MAIDFDASRMLEVCENYERWWRGELERPLIHGIIYNAHTDSRTEKAPLLSQRNCNDFSWDPEQLIDTIDLQLSRYEYIGDGYPHVNFDAFGPGVVAAFCGAEMDNRSGSVCFLPKQAKEISEISIKYDPDNIWSRRIKNIYRAGMERWDGTVIMGMPDLGGILDILASVCGNEQLLFALMDEPEEIQRLIGEVQTAWYSAYDDFSEVLKPQKLYSDWSMLLSRTPSYILQCDFSYMISQEMFREFVMRSLREDTRRLQHTIYHLDGVEALRHLEEILKLKDLNAVQWVWGAGKQGASHWLDIYKRILEAGKQIMVIGGADEFYNVLKEVHGSPYAALYFAEQDRDYAMKIIKAR